jgi:streptogramin lyase
MTMGTPKSLLKAAARGKGVALRRLLEMLTMAFALLVMVGQSFALEMAYHELNSTPYGITKGPDGNVWVSGSSLSKVTTNGDETQYSQLNGGNYVITGNDNNLWSTSGKNIFKTTTNGEQTTYAVDSTVGAIIKGADGNQWFTTSDNKVGKITSEGAYTYYALPTTNIRLSSGIASGPDGNIWVAGVYKTDSETFAQLIRITTSGSITEFPIAGAPLAIDSLTSGPDGKIWFTAPDSYKIGKMTTSGTVTLYNVPNVKPNKILSGSDGNLWFSVYGLFIGKITTSGDISSFDILNRYANDIACGPDGNMWFTTIDDTGAAYDAIIQVKISFDPLTSSGKHLIWQNTSTGEMRWWSMSTTGKIVNDTVDVGHGLISDEPLTSEWRFAGTTTLDGAKTLFYQNTSTGYVKYWKLDGSGKLSSSGLVSDTLTVKGAWKAVGVKTLNGAPTIIWQNQSSGKVVYWLLNSTGALLSATKNEGWGYVSESLTVNSNWRLSSVTTLGGSNVLLWQNQSNGKIVYWKLDGANKLVNETKDSGWGFVSSLTLASQWRQVGIVNSNALIWQGQSYGKIAWWKLGDDAKLISSDKDNGWGYVSDKLTLNSSWSLGAVSELGGFKTFIWHNSAMGVIAYWKINDSLKLYSEFKDLGWGYVSNTLTMSSNWTLNCITD